MPRALIQCAGPGEGGDGGAVLQRLNFTFEPDDVDERMCVIENLPRTIVAGEQFAMQIRVRDAFKNGLSGLEPSICLLPKDPAEATAIAKVSGTDLGKGNYVMSSKIYKSFHHFGISIHAGGKIIHSAVIEARPPYPRPARPTARALRHSFAFCALYPTAFDAVAARLRRARSEGRRRRSPSGCSGSESVSCPKETADRRPLVAGGTTATFCADAVRQCAGFRAWFTIPTALGDFSELLACCWAGAWLGAPARQVLPAKAKAKNCDFECSGECRAHFPVVARLLLRDEFGNIAFPDEGYFSVEVEGCALQASDVARFAEAGGVFSIAFLPRTSGEVSVKVVVSGELLAVKRVAVRALGTWTKEDARDWISTLGFVEPRLAPVAAALSDQFIRQGVTGAKVAGGLLDRGAFHFAFGIEDMATAQFLANCLSDLSKGPSAPAAYLPWSWRTSGAPGQLVPLGAGDEGYSAVVDRFKRTMGAATVTAVERLESAALYTRYAGMRTAVGNVRGGNPNERMLWHAAPAPHLAGLVDVGFAGPKMRADGPGVYGAGFYFAADPRLADLWHARAGGGGDVAAERCLVLARVACGTVAAREALPDGDRAALARELERLENLMAPPGSHAASGPDRVEAVVFKDHMAYPEYVVRYTLASAPLEVEWPRSGPAGPAASPPLLKVDEVAAAL